IGLRKTHREGSGMKWRHEVHDRSRKDLSRRRAEVGGDAGRREFQSATGKRFYLDDSIRRGARFARGEEADANGIAGGCVRGELDSVDLHLSAGFRALGGGAREGCEEQQSGEQGRGMTRVGRIGIGLGSERRDAKSVTTTATELDASR